MKIAFRVDSSPTIGAGHFMRCFSLAQELIFQGHECAFICSEISADHIKKLVASKVNFHSVSDGDKASGNETSSHLKANRVDAIIVDHYGLDGSWEHNVSSNLSRLVAIDDLQREHIAGSMIVDPTLGREPTAYNSSNYSQSLCGSKYALLEKQYYALHEDRLLSEGDRKRSLLICFGGSLAADLTLKTLQTLDLNEHAIFDEINVVLPCSDFAAGPVKELCDKLNATFFDWVEDMPQLLARTTHSIGAPGGMAWERAALGIPSIVVQIADNQADNLKMLQKAGAIEVCTLENIAEKLPTALSRLEQNYSELSRRSLNIADGLGTRRVAQVFSNKTANDGKPIFLRPVEERDIKTVFDWQNEPGTRKYSLNPEPPKWESHQAWMHARLNVPTTHFHIIEHGGNPAGFVRLDREGSRRYRISILVSQAFQKLGIAGITLERVSTLHREVEIAATVLPGNSASVALFSKAGYRQLSSSEYLLKASL
ncbi:MAG: UDP-2,4-diacetamido-2,4,6-trideoxy-beta-L-altropyranose hydrolase [Salaquimonas sp.]